MDMSKVFSEYIEGEENYKIAYDIVRQNSKGNVWLIGGGLSRNLNELIYGTVQHSFDFDFVVEESVDDINLPEGWSMRKNKSGYFRFVKGDLEIDYIPLKDAGFIVRNNLKPTVENLLIGTPFTIQALAYDCETKKIIGDVGIDALKKKFFEINNLDEAKILAKRKDVELNDLILKKAESMGFKGVICDEEFITSENTLGKDWKNKMDKRWNNL